MIKYNRDLYLAFLFIPPPPTPLPPIRLELLNSLHSPAYISLNIHLWRSNSIILLVNSYSSLSSVLHC